MFEDHFNAIEKLLLAQSEIVNNAGHNNLKGGPREWFIKDFLENHIPSNIEIGQGEIIGDLSSKGDRPQIDIVLYDKDLPKLCYDPYNTAFLIEGVIAVIECKSNFGKKELKQVCKAGKYINKLSQNVVESKEDKSHSGVLNAVISYKGASLKTIIKYLKKEEEEISKDAVDLIVILGQGIIWKQSIIIEYSYDESDKNRKNMKTWAYIKQPDKNLYYFFTLFLSWLANYKNFPNLREYNSDFILEKFETF